MQEDIQTKRLEFVKTATNSTSVSQETALELLRIGRSEWTMLFKNIEAEWWKHKASQAEIQNLARASRDSSSSLDAVKDLLKSYKRTVN